MTKDLENMKTLRDVSILNAQEHLGKFPVVQMSYWSFNMYKTCPQQFALRAIKPDKPPKEDAFWAINGSVVHSVWEDFTKEVKGGSLKWEDRSFLTENVEPRYDNIVEDRDVDWDSHGVTPSDHRKDAIPDLISSISFLYDMLQSEGLIPRDPRTIHTEFSFKTQLTRAVRITGRTDLVFEDPDSITIVDLKDVSKRSNINWRQLVWYTLGLEPVFKKKVDKAGFLLTKLQEWSWRNPDAKDYRLTLKREILETALKIRREPFRAIVSRHSCPYCVVNKMCPEWVSYSGRTDEVLNTISLLDEGVVGF